MYKCNASGIVEMIWHVKQSRGFPYSSAPPLLLSQYGTENPDSGVRWPAGVLMESRGVTEKTTDPNQKLKSAF